MVGDAGDPGGGGFLAEEFGNWSGSRLRPLQQLDPVALVIGELAAEGECRGRSLTNCGWSRQPGFAVTGAMLIAILRVGKSALCS